MGDVTVPMDDASLYAAALSDEKPAASEQQPSERQEEARAEPVVEQERPRDEQGRFAPRAEKPAEQQQEPAKADGQQQPDPDQSAQVPSWRLRELREEREAAIRRATEAEERAQRLEAEHRRFLAQQQQANQPKPPDLLADPDAWQQHLAQQHEAGISRVRFELSEDMARAQFGDEKVDTALKWLQGNLDPVTRQRVMTARNPYREMVKLHDERQTLQQIGGDLGAYRTKLLDDALNDPAFLQKVADKLRADQGQSPTNGSRPVVQLPPSIGRATGANIPKGGGLTDADMSDQALYAHATARR